MKKAYRLIVFNYNSTKTWNLYGPYTLSFAAAVLEMLQASKDGRSFRVIHDSFCDSLDLFEAPTPEEDQVYYTRYASDTEKFIKTRFEEQNPQVE